MEVVLLNNGVTRVTLNCLYYEYNPGENSASMTAQVGSKVLSLRFTRLRYIFPTVSSRDLLVDLLNIILSSTHSIYQRRNKHSKGIYTKRADAEKD